MLGLAPLAGATLADDGDRLSRIQSSAVGDLAFGGDIAARATVGASAAPGALFSFGGTASGNSSLTVGCTGGLNAAGNAQLAGAAAAIAAGTFIAINTAVAAPHSAGSINGDIELAGQSAGRTKGSGELRGLWNGHGTAAAWSATLASGSGRLEAPGDAQGSASLQSGGAGSITFARQLEAEGDVEGTVARGIGIGGATNGTSRTDGASAGDLGLNGRTSASAVQNVVANSPMGLSGFGQAETVCTSGATAVGPALSGFAIGTTLQARFADIAGRLSLGVRASATIEAHAIADAVVAVSLDAFGTVKARSMISGGLSLARELNAGVLATGETDREIGLAGKARAAAVTAADAPAVKLEVTGGSEARGASVGSVRHELAVSSQTELESSVSGGASAAFTLSLRAVIANGVGAVGNAQVPMRGASRFVTDVAAVAADHMRFFGQSACDVRPDARLGGQFGIAGGATGGIASLGQGRGTLDVVRDFAGDVDVLGDSARQISFRGAASARSTSTGETSNPVVEVTGAASARATAAVETAANVALPCSAKAGVPAAATTSFAIGWITEAAATVPRSVQSNGRLSLVGTGQARSAARGAAVADLLVIAGDLGGAMDLIAKLQGDLALEDTAEASASVAAEGSGQFSVGRDSNADVQVAGDAARLLPLVGTAAGALVARATRVDGTIALAGTGNARAETAASLPSGATLDLQGHATGAARAQSISSGRVAFIRLGQGDVLVVGSAARGIALLGSAQAGNVTRAAVNLPLAPGLAGSAANVIHLDFTAEAIAPGGRAAGSNLAHASEVSAWWNLHITAIAYRAPPALRRSEPAKCGLSGRLSPSNSGRILRG